MVEDDRPAPPKPMALDGLSIAELEHRIERLRVEIAQCEALIAQKRSHRSAADTLFGAPSSS